MTKARSRISCWDLKPGDLILWWYQPTTKEKKRYFALVIGPPEQISIEVLYQEETEMVWAIPVWWVNNISANQHGSQHLRCDTYEYWRDESRFELEVIREGEIP